MKAGDTAYLVESNRFVHEVEILRCNGELYIVCFKDNGVGFYFKAYHLLLTSWKTVKGISQAPEHKFRKIHMIIGIETIGKRIKLFKTAAIYR